MFIHISGQYIIYGAIDCSLRVLGSQFDLDPGKLSDLERRSAQTSTDLRDLLLDECFRQGKIKSWQPEFVTVLEKPALGQRSIADEIRKKFSESTGLNGFCCLIYQHYCHNSSVTLAIPDINGNIRVIFFINGQ